MRFNPFSMNYIFDAKIMYCIIVGSLYATLLLYFETYVFNDWQFAISLLTLITIDTILAVWDARKRNAISSRDWAKIFDKLKTYFLLLVAAKAATYYKVGGVDNNLLTWVNNAICAAMIVRELISILENCGKLGFIVPAWILAKLKDFDENGKFKDESKKV